MASPASPCPRCQSSNTKFCYFNNYNVKQPRFFCKSCQRYWTAGGSLRNVPVGSGRRKNKRAAVNKPRPGLSSDVIEDNLSISGMNVSPRTTVFPSRESESVSCELRLALPRESTGRALSHNDDNHAELRASSLSYCKTMRSVQDHSPDVVSDVEHGKCKYFHSLSESSPSMAQPCHVKHEENLVSFGIQPLPALAQPYHVKKEEEEENVTSFGAKPYLEEANKRFLHVETVKRQDMVLDRSEAASFFIKQSYDIQEEHETQYLDQSYAKQDGLINRERREGPFLNLRDVNTCPPETVKIGAFDGLSEERFNILNGKNSVWRHVRSQQDVKNDVLPSSASVSSSTASSDRAACEMSSKKCTKNNQSFKMSTIGGEWPADAGSCVPNVCPPNYMMWYPYMWWTMQMPVWYPNCANSKILGKHYRSTSADQEESVCAPKSLKFGHAEEAQYASTLAALGLGN